MIGSMVHLDREMVRELLLFVRLLALRRRGLDPRPDNAISAATRLLHQHGGTASKCCPRARRGLPEGPAAPGAAKP